MNKSTMWWIIGLVVVAVIAIVIISKIGSNAESIEQDSTTQATPTTNSSGAIVSETRANETVFAIAENISGSSQFASLLLNTGVGVSVGTTTYTVFVPTDAAFSKLGSGYISNLSSAQKKSLAQYHVVTGRTIDLDALKFGTIQATSKDALNFSVGPDGIPKINNSAVVRQYKAKNGIVYVIDAVLLPPKK
jgi:uncharacterized surface protein with fasciclin (FAS1) repeats